MPHTSREEERDERGWLTPRARTARYRAKHRDKVLLKDRESAALYRKNNPDKIADAREANREKTRAADNARNAKRRAENPERERQKAREIYAANPQRYCAASKRHEALKRGALISDFTAEQWRDMQTAYNHRCAYCGKRAKRHLTQDHITPLSKGGSHTLNNIVPACKSCNSKKHIGPPPVPVQPLLL